MKRRVQVVLNATLGQKRKLRRWQRLCTSLNYLKDKHTAIILQGLLCLVIWASSIRCLAKQHIYFFYYLKSNFKIKIIDVIGLLYSTTLLSSVKNIILIPQHTQIAIANQRGGQ